MKNNIEIENQEIQNIFDEYLVERTKNISIFDEFVSSLIGETKYSEEEIVKLKLKSSKSKDYRSTLNDYLESCIERESFLFRVFTCFSISTIFGILFTISLSYEQLLIEGKYFLSLTLPILPALVAIIFAIVFFRSARKYRILCTKINYENGNFSQEEYLKNTSQFSPDVEYLFGVISSIIISLVLCKLLLFNTSELNPFFKGIETTLLDGSSETLEIIDSLPEMQKLLEALMAVPSILTTLSVIFSYFDLRDLLILQTLYCLVSCFSIYLLPNFVF